MKKKLPLTVCLISIISLSSCADMDTLGYCCLSELLTVPLTEDSYYTEEELYEMSDFVYEVTVKEQQYSNRVTTFDVNHLFMSDEAAQADNDLYNETNGQEGLPGYNWYFTYYELKVNTIIKEDIEIPTYYDEYFPDWDEEVDGLKCMITAGAFFFGATADECGCYHANTDENLIIGYDYRVYLKYWAEQDCILTTTGSLGQGAVLLTKINSPYDNDEDEDLEEDLDSSEEDSE
ncbi:MAG: hypothetical protein LUD22_04210 [Coprobacillus sp.]|nr:hypothetical protein [Coprobacillus sp.]